MVNRAAEDTPQGKTSEYLHYTIALEKVHEESEELIVITKTYDLILWVLQPHE